MPGSFRLFRFRGIDVYLHWLWFAMAAYSITSRREAYTSAGWNIAEYLALFLFVLLHEFGHAFACRQTGGEANRIILWPLGGVAFVHAPNRPGAQLWSIVAGPLVNVVLVIVLGLAALFLVQQGWPDQHPEGYKFLTTLVWINVGLLIFNLLPIYPLDGGQIVRSLLWFFLGAANSLFVATLLGFLGGLSLAAFALWHQMYFLLFVTVYLLMGNWSGFQSARALRHLSQQPRHSAFRCPHCQAPALSGSLWACPICQSSFDFFTSDGTCPQGHHFDPPIPCPECGRATALNSWRRSPRS
jgi:Zn-dependent protease